MNFKTKGSQERTRPCMSREKGIEGKTGESPKVNVFGAGHFAPCQF